MVIAAYILGKLALVRRPAREIEFRDLRCSIVAAHFVQGRRRLWHVRCWAMKRRLG